MATERVGRRIIDAHSHIGEMAAWKFYDLKEPVKPTVFGRVLNRLRLGRGVRIQGVDGLMVRYAQCCQPVPGDPVVGYVTQGRGISIHRANCSNLIGG